MALTEEQKNELLDWVSACQSSYHIINTANHRFAAVGSHLEENRAGLIDYVESLLKEAAAPAQAEPSDDAKDAARYRYLRNASLNEERELDVCDDAMNVFFGEDLDIAIDDAIDAAAQNRP